MKILKIGQPSCYQIMYQDNASQNLVVTFTPNRGFFLQDYDLNASKLCIASNRPNYYLWNVGLACDRIASFLKDTEIKYIICIGLSKAGFASILWAHLLKVKLPKSTKVFALSFTPQTLLYPFNERLTFPSYRSLWNSIDNNSGMKICATNYGDLNKVLLNSDLEGLVFYPQHNLCDRVEAERLTAKNIKLRGVNFELHDTFLPFMPQSKDDEKLQEMIDKLYNNALKNEDINFTTPKDKEKTFKLVKSISAEVPTINELLHAIFLRCPTRKI